MMSQLSQLSTPANHIMSVISLLYCIKEISQFLQCE